MNSNDVTDAFPEVQKWTINMIESMSQDKIGSTSTVSCVQFSGISQLEKDYQPGNNGRAGVSGLEHYRIEVPATQILPGNMSSIKNQVILGRKPVQHPAWSFIYDSDHVCGSIGR